ncbi:hypothetical protein Agub_g13262, partial [Astrephomene gubernaculifera]
ESRAQSLAALNALKARAAAVQTELAAYRDSDPETVEAMRNAAEAAKLAANRWLDNTYSLLSWCKKKFAGREAELAKFFEEVWRRTVSMKRPSTSSSTQHQVARRGATRKKTSREPCCEQSYTHQTHLRPGTGS